MLCDACQTRLPCNCERHQVFYRVKPFDWNFKPGGRSGTSYAIEECRIVANSRNKEDAETLVARLNEWRKLKRDNAMLKSQLASRDTGKIALYRVENIIDMLVDQARCRRRFSFGAVRVFAEKVKAHLNAITKD